MRTLAVFGGSDDRDEMGSRDNVPSFTTDEVRVYADWNRTPGASIWEGEADDDDAPITQRETIPVPRESGIRLHAPRVRNAAATAEVVVCDLTRDPRSEDFDPSKRR